MEEATRGIATAVTASTKRVAEASEEGGEAIKTSLVALAGKLDTTPLPADLLTAALTQPLAKLAEQLDDFSSVLDSSYQGHRQIAEAAQELGAIGTVALATGETPDFEEVLTRAGQAALAGAVGGGSFGGTFGFFGEARRVNAEITEEARVTAARIFFRCFS